ncbi:MAG TPA: tail fiber protein, partial [Dissulfurispiraceae bacterium]|nr:tail fiber protein [Dissulfurispiraceae bacterium]
MSNPYIGEIKMFGGNFAPVGWALCNGQLLPISENDALFNLIGTTYGGDGQTTFALPDLRSRIPVHAGSGYTLAQTGGVETVTLTTTQIPSHTHMPQCNSGSGTQNSPAGNVWASAASAKQFTDQAPNVTMNPAAMISSGGGQP